MLNVFLRGAPVYPTVRTCELPLATNSHWRSQRSSSIKLIYTTTEHAARYDFCSPAVAPGIPLGVRYYPSQVNAPEDHTDEKDW